MKVSLATGQPLKVGTYLHCLISTTQKVAMLAGEGRTVGVVVDPKKVYRSLVSVRQRLLCCVIFSGKLLSIYVFGVQNRFHLPYPCTSGVTVGDYVSTALLYPAVSISKILLTSANDLPKRSVVYVIVGDINHMLLVLHAKFNT